MPKARIFQPDKNAMQSGKAKDAWVLEFEPAAAMVIDPLTGWSGMKDTTRQLKLKFATKDEAIAYATRQKLEFEVSEPKKRSLVKKAYADNFKANRVK